MKTISIVTPCFNEQQNVEELYEQIKEVFAKLPNYSYEHIFIDNASTDDTVKTIKKIAEHDKNIKLIENSRNFGHIRSPFHGILQARGDAVILMASDLQDPPSLIPEFIKQWEENYKIVVGIKNQSDESSIMFAIRKLGYNVISKLANINLIKNFTGFGLYDQVIIQVLRQIDDPYPYFRGLISEIGFEVAKVYFTQPERKHGKSKNNFYTLYDIGMLGITNYSKIPMRLATMAGFVLASISLFLSLMFLVLKIIFWKHFSLGVAPILIGMFFIGSVQLFFLGLFGEYIAAIHTQVQRRPLVVEKERTNFIEPQ